MLDPNKRLDIEEILQDLESYRPRRKGWVWREAAPGLNAGGFDYKEISKPLKQSVPLKVSAWRL